jgi:hypothetical protein
VIRGSLIEGDVTDHPRWAGGPLSPRQSACAPQMSRLAARSRGLAGVAGSPAGELAPLHRVIVVSSAAEIRHNGLTIFRQSPQHDLENPIGRGPNNRRDGTVRGDDSPGVRSRRRPGLRWDWRAVLLARLLPAAGLLSAAAGLLPAAACGLCAAAAKLCSIAGGWRSGLLRRTLCLPDGSSGGDRWKLLLPG